MPPSAPTSPNVVSIFDGEPTAQGVMPELVTMLDEAMGEVQTGLVRGMMIVVAKDDGGYETWHYDHGQGFRLLGLASIGAHNLTKHLAGE